MIGTLARCRLGKASFDRRHRPILCMALGAVFFLATLPQNADATGLRDPGSCSNKPDYNTTENKVHIALCEGRDIVLGPNEVISARVLIDEITDEAHLVKHKGHGFFMTGGEVSGQFDLRGRYFDVPIFKISSTFDDIVYLSDTHFGGSLDLQNSSFRRGLSASRMVVDGFVMLGNTDDSNYDGKLQPGGPYIEFIKAPHIRIAGDLVIAGATIDKDLNISNSQISGSATVSHVIAKNIDFSATEVGNQLIFFNCRVDQSGATQNENSNLNLYSIRTKQSVYLNRLTVRDDIVIQDAEIEGDLLLLGTTLTHMDAKSSSVTGAFSVGENTIQPPKWTKWNANSSLDLTDSRLGSIRTPADIDVWPASIYFNDLSFKSITAGNCGLAHCELPVQWFGKWLSKQPDDNADRKSFEPYKAVADFLTSRGQVLEGNSLAVLGHDIERVDAYRHGEYARYILLSIYGYSVGYGYELYLVVIPTIIFVVIGAVTFRNTKEAKARHMPYGIFYSFDMLLPIIRLREYHYKIDLKGKARYYFYFHKLVGWALGFILIAALGGIAK